MKRLAVMSIAAFMVLHQLACAQQQQPKRRLSYEELSSPKIVAEWKERQAAIDQEISKLKDHPWAGTYYQGDGMGANLTITLAPKNGFVFIWRGCLGVYDRNEGKVAATNDGALRLSYRFANEQRGLKGVAPELLPVSWGGRQYLVPADDVVGFCNAINEGFEPRDGRYGLFFLRPGDEKIPVTGAPSLPKKYLPYLLDHPIDAEIIEVHETKIAKQNGAYKEYATTVTLNVGHSEKVLPGMGFNVRGLAPWDWAGEVHAVSISEMTSEAMVRHWSEKPPEVGWKLTTGSRCCPPIPVSEEEGPQP